MLHNFLFFCKPFFSNRWHCSECKNMRSYNGKREEINYDYFCFVFISYFLYGNLGVFNSLSHGKPIIPILMIKLKQNGLSRVR